MPGIQPGHACALMVALAGCARAVPNAPGDSGHVSATSTSPVQLRAETASPERRINLGRGLFEPGSIEFAAGGAETITKAFADVRTGARVRIDVFADRRAGRLGHSNSVMATRLSQLRADALRTELISRGFRVERADGRGFDEVGGREADRRAEVVVIDDGP